MSAYLIRIHAKYRKQMKRDYCKLLYNQLNKKDETTMSVLKRILEGYLMSRLTRIQNLELLFRYITFNINTCIESLTDYIIILMMFKPISKKNLYIIIL